MRFDIPAAPANARFARLRGVARRLLSAWLAAVPLAGLAQAAATGPSVREQADARALALVRQMSLDEKIGQLLNVAPAIPRLGIPGWNWWTESLHGAIGPVATTNYPEPIGLAATFDVPLVKEVGARIGVELRALHTLQRDAQHRLGRVGGSLDTWSPNINIFRDPRWGRGQETYGEDPFLTARLAVGLIQGLQGPDPDLPRVIATPKHLAVHSGPESTRHQADVFVSRHDLEDTYLPAFRAAIVEGRAGSVMCAYNRVDGQPACASHELLDEHLRGAWGFQGYVVSDCDAVRDFDEHHKYTTDPAASVAIALRAGVDNECNTGTLWDMPGMAERYGQALARGLLAESDIDRALVRLFSARLRTGDLPGVSGTAPAVPATEVDTPAHRALALKAATRSLVLLKNDGVLPLAPGLRIAVIGPHGAATRVLRGNYSPDRTGTPVSVVEGLRQAMPRAQVELVPFTASPTDGDLVPDTAVFTPDGRPGLLAQYFKAGAAGDTFEQVPAVTQVEPNLLSRGLLLPGMTEKHRVVWTGFLVAPESGTWRVALNGVKGCVRTGGAGVCATAFSTWGAPLEFVDVQLEKGRRYPLRLENDTSASAAPGLLWKRITTRLDADLKAAVARADVVVAAVGLSTDLEGEEMAVKEEGFAGGDKTTLDLPAAQRRMLETAAALGKPLVVVLMNGSALDLRWAKAHAAAIVEAWYPGETGGRAIADVLAGHADPGGRLPVTFYAGVDDLPPFDDYRMAGRTYRYFGGTPVYPFGFGLSYTQFGYGELHVEPSTAVRDGLQVTATVRNTGRRAGDEVVQLYLTPPRFPGAPRLALRGFERVTLEPGQSRQVRFDLSPRDLSFVTADGERRVIPGRYEISVGSGQPGTGVDTVSAAIPIETDEPLPR